MADGAELGRGSPDHGVIHDAEDRKGYNNPNGNEDGWFYSPFPQGFLGPGEKPFLHLPAPDRKKGLSLWGNNEGYGSYD
jgi:hypothetical protein